MRVIANVFLLSIFLLFSCTNSNTVDKVPKKDLNKNYSKIDFKTLKFSQTVYVPIYSEIYSRSEKHVFQLTSTLSIRNISLKDSLFVSEINYYNSKGDFVRNYTDKMIFLKPLETIEFIVEEKDISGGMGANFLILWGSNIENLNPVFQGVMIGTSNQQGISFITNGVVISE
ncbi:MAG: DUF3124 domain-containing protein [Bacteroidales bacterium]|nr:DUF3124 domain-containing protein [Bacteroidales bacterium]